MRRVWFTHKTQSSSGSCSSPPKCSALAFFALGISRCNITCVTFQRSGFGSVLSSVSAPSPNCLLCNLCFFAQRYPQFYNKDRILVPSPRKQFPSNQSFTSFI